MNNADDTLMDRIHHLDEAHHDQMIDAIAQTDDFDDDQDPEDENQERWFFWGISFCPDFQLKI